jgi:hypothetical protein
VVRYHGRYLQLSPSSRRYAPRQGAVLVYESEDGKLEVHYRGEPIAHQEIAAPVRPENPRAAMHVPYSRPRYRHGPEHPYKRHADRQIKRQRLRQLKQAVAARAVGGGGGAAPPGGGGRSRRGGGLRCARPCRGSRGTGLRSSPRHGHSFCTPTN